MKVGLTLDVTSTRGKGTQHGRVHWVKDSTDCSLTQLLSQPINNGNVQENSYNKQCMRSEEMLLLEDLTVSSGCQNSSKNNL